jgi:hypothetical protein
MVDELLSRRSPFRPGRKIRLADGQLWTLPVPGPEWSDKAHSNRHEYHGLICAIAQADDDAERCLAELAFAILLLDQNYCLTPADYQQLLEFPAKSRESAAWEIALGHLILEHLHVFQHGIDVADVPEDLSSISMSLRYRLRAWLGRTFMPIRWRSFDSRSF